MSAAPNGLLFGNRRPGAEQPNAINLGRALCGDSARPRCRRTEKCEELPPPHVALLKGSAPSAVQENYSTEYRTR